MIIYKHKFESKVLPKLEKLAKRAARLSLPALTWQVVDAPAMEIRPYANTCLGPYATKTDKDVPLMSPIWLSDPNPPSLSIYLVPQVEVTITGLVPVLADWALVARIEHDRELNTNLIHVVPGSDNLDLSSFRARRTCDHCNTDRFRNDTYILSGPKGEVKQVGRNCLADYLRSQAYAEYIMMLGTFLDTWNEGSDPDKEVEYRSYGVVAYDLESVIILAFASIRQFGFVSSKCEYGVSTKYRVQDHLDRVKGANIDILDQDKDQATLALAWIKAQGEDDSDYIRNLKLLCSLDYIEAKRLGYIVSLPAAYLKAMDQELFKAPKLPSSKVGTIGAKVELTVTVDKLRTIETDYGYSTLVIMTDKEGNDLTWFASNLPDDIEAGKDYKIKGTVKDHAEYKGRIQTKLTRCKLGLAS